MNVATEEIPAIRFSLEEARRAAEDWGFNCGPAAIAAITGMTLADLRSHLGDFESKRYTNPKLMWDILGSLRIDVRVRSIASNVPVVPWPVFGLARVQWEGPWTKPGVPMRVRYRHSHWVALAGGMIFDVNAMSVGGWIFMEEWEQDLVPWLLQQCEPKADGKWHLTHTVEIQRAR